MLPEVAAVKRALGKQVRLTPQRRWVVETLARNTGQHMSAEEVYQALRRERKKVGMATVYRTLGLLEERGIVNRLDVHDGSARYELKLDSEAHCHLICLQCGKVEEITLASSGQWQPGADVRGFKIVEASVRLFGYCQQCRARTAFGQEP